MGLKSIFTSAQAVFLADYTRSERADVKQVFKTLVQTPGLSQTGFQGHEKTAEVRALEDLLARAPQVALIVFWRSAELAVTDELSAGRALDQALGHWDTAHQALLGFYRKHRQNVVLVDFDAFCGAPGSFAALLQAQTGLTFSAAHSSNGFHVDPVYRAIAALKISQSLNSLRIDGELEASSIWPQTRQDTGGARNIQVDAAVARYQKVMSAQTEAAEGLEEARAKQEAEQLASQTEAAEAAKANDLLVQQLHAAQEELESYYLTAQKLEQGAVQQESEAQAAAAGLSDLGKTNDLLTLQLHNVQEELEDYYLALQKREKDCADYESQLKAAHKRKTHLQAEKAAAQEHQDRVVADQTAALEASARRIADLERELGESKDTVAQLVSSTSWKVTGPIRKVKDSLKGSKDEI